MKPVSANFESLEKRDVQLVRLGALAERYFKDDPNTCLIKLPPFQRGTCPTNGGESRLSGLDGGASGRSLATAEI